MSELSLPDAAQGPARPRRLTVDFYEDADPVMIRKRRGGGPWPFFLPWLIGWTIGCVLLISKVFDDPSVGNLAFGLPFCVMWLAVAGMLIWMLFAKETFYLGRDEVVFERRAVVLLSTRVVPRDEVQIFRECRSTYNENDQPLLGIEMLTLGTPLRFAFRLPAGERAWLIHQLNRFLTASSWRCAAPGSPAAMTTPLDKPSGNTSAEHAVTEALTYDRTLAVPPSDWSWRLAEDADGFAFWQQGRLNIGQLAGLLFVNLFWNGIILVFVMVLLGQMPGRAPEGWEWWGLCVFLIPFEVLGLAVIVLLVLTVLEPWRRTSWQFGEERIVRQWRWPFFRYTRSWVMPRLDRLELRRLNPSDRQRFRTAIVDPLGQRSFALAIVSSDNVDVCDIGSLTEGEARWMARVILKRRPRSFRLNSSGAG